MRDLYDQPCSNPDCLYLHEIGSQEDSFTKDEIISAYTRFVIFVFKLFNWLKRRRVFKYIVVDKRCVLKHVYWLCFPLLVIACTECSVFHLIISWLTLIFWRSRVQQITGATSNMQRRSGNVLPPPLDDNMNTTPAKPIVKNPSSVRHFIIFPGTHFVCVSAFAILMLRALLNFYL